jgi:DNA-binding NarL/FixJ family response regulator
MIQKQLSYGFRNLKGEAKEEAMQEAIVNCTVCYAQLHEKGHVDKASATSLARYAIRQVKSGRTIGSKLNVREPLSRYAQVRKQFRVSRLDHFDRARECWLPPLVEDPRISVLEQVALRIDVPHWLSAFSRRAQNIARDLAYGFTTSEIAQKYRLSPGRISQMRREFYQSWLRFPNSSAFPEMA